MSAERPEAAPGPVLRLVMVSGAGRRLLMALGVDRGPGRPAKGARP